MINISKVIDKEQKATITNQILRSLPDWFGIEEGIIEYSNGVKENTYYIAIVNEKQVGFLSVKNNNSDTSEIYVMAILEQYHSKGIGRALLERAQDDLSKNHVKFLMVKTLGESHPDPYYKKTREFYHRVGFSPLEEIEAIWGAENPCLLMVKSL
jgi:ribosomal protein S18 acetylase RimI-like enzyme